MGCTQTSESVIPPNHIPIEPLYDTEGYPLTKATPAVMITAPPTPTYIKSALKKTHPDGRGRTERLSFLIRKPPSINRSVNFDEHVLVKARTPTPSKIWYEKSSTTMPMRKHPRNDDDDDDYDDEDIPSISSDEEQETNERTDTESSPLLLQRNQTNTFWPQPNTIGFMPTTDTMLENEYYSPTMQQSSFNRNTYPTESPTSTPINRIKVRRKLPNFDPPQISFVPSYQSPYPSSIQPSLVPAYHIPPQIPFVSPYQSSTLPSSQTFHAQRTIPNRNALLVEHRRTSINGESLPQTTSYAVNRHPLENVT